MLLGSLALILSAGLVACDDNANGAADEGAETDSALTQETLPEVDTLKPADPGIPEIDLSQPAPIIAGPGADTGDAGMGGADADETGMGEVGMPGEEGGLDQGGVPEGAPAEDVAPTDTGAEPDQVPLDEGMGAGAAEADDATAGEAEGEQTEEDGGPEEME